MAGRDAHTHTFVKLKKLVRSPLYNFERSCCYLLSLILVQENCLISYSRSNMPVRLSSERQSRTLRQCSGQIRTSNIHFINFNLLKCFENVYEVQMYNFAVNLSLFHYVKKIIQCNCDPSGNSV